MILSVDIGSSSVRALAFDAQGMPVVGIEARRAHRFVTTGAGRVEADPESVFGFVVECLDESLAQAEARGDRVRGAGSIGRGGIQAVAFCSFWHGLLGASRDGAPLTPVLTWADTRAAGQAMRLRAELDPETVRQRTGCPLHPSYFPAKLAWWAESEPDTFRQVHWWGNIGELCFMRFFGKRACSLSLASGSGLLDRNTLAWDPELLACLGVGRESLSELSDLPSRGLREPFASRWPRLAGIPWFPALGDGACSNVGCGCAMPARAAPVGAPRALPRAAIMIGTTGAFRVVRPRSVQPIPRGLWSYLVDASRMLMGGVLGDGGNLADWISFTMALGAPREELDRALLRAEPAGHGLTVLPFLTGERSTGWNPLARGAIVGLRTDTSSLDILQAGFEGVAYRFAAVKSRLQEAMPLDGELVGTGGGLLGSAAWCQIVADSLDARLECSSVAEASSRGAALLALESLGDGLATARAPAPGRTFSPRPNAVVAHRRARQEQERIYASLWGSVVE